MTGQLPTPTDHSGVDDVAATAEAAAVPVRGERLLTAPELAELLAVPESWVREETREGRIPHLRLGRYRRYHWPTIQAWLTGRQAGPKAGNRR